MGNITKNNAKETTLLKAPKIGLAGFVGTSVLFTIALLGLSYFNIISFFHCIIAVAVVLALFFAAKFLLFDKLSKLFSLSGSSREGKAVNLVKKLKVPELRKLLEETKVKKSDIPVLKNLLGRKIEESDIPDLRKLLSQKEVNIDALKDLSGGKVEESDIPNLRNALEQKSEKLCLMAIRNLFDKKEVDIDALKNLLGQQVEESDIHALRKLLDKNPNKESYFFDPDCVCSPGNHRLLMIASELGDKTMVDFLISKGADVNLEDLFGNTAFMYAIRSGSINTTNILESFIAKDKTLLNHANKDGVTPLTLAIRRKKFDLSQFLVNNGAEVNILEKVGDRKSPFDLASESKQENLKRFLESRNALPSKTRKESFSLPSKIRKENFISKIIYSLCPGGRA